MTKYRTPDPERRARGGEPAGAPRGRRWRRPAGVRAVPVMAVTGLLLAAGCASGDTDTTSASTLPAAANHDVAVTLTDDRLVAEIAVTGLDQPSSLAVLDDAMLVTEKATGRVQVVRDDVVVGEAIDLAVNSFDERGLLGIAVHPTFPAEPYVYLHWTWRGDGDGDDRLLGDDSDAAHDVPTLGNRVDRFRWHDDTLTFDRNIVEFPSATLESDTSDRVRGNHDAGPLGFGPDGKLYTMMGDQNLRGQLQNIADGAPPDDAHLAGVILRLDDDGAVPEDNPFFETGATIGGEVGENIQMIYAYGVRNSFGLAFEPRSGALWISENGDDSYDEINVIDAGANSGWIQVQGPTSRVGDYRDREVESDDGLDVPSFPPDALAGSADDALARLHAMPGSAFAEPVLSYVHPPAVTAIALVPDAHLGGSDPGSLWVGTVLTDALLRYPLGADGRTLDLNGPLADGIDDNGSKGDLGESAGYVVGTGFGVITDIDLAPDGALYVVSLDRGAVIRLTDAKER